VKTFIVFPPPHSNYLGPLDYWGVSAPPNPLNGRALGQQGAYETAVHLVTLCFQDYAKSWLFPFSISPDPMFNCSKTDLFVLFFHRPRYSQHSSPAPHFKRLSVIALRYSHRPCLLYIAYILTGNTEAQQSCLGWSRPRLPLSQRARPIQFVYLK